MDEEGEMAMKCMGYVPVRLHFECNMTLLYRGAIFWNSVTCAVLFIELLLGKEKQQFQNNFEFGLLAWSFIEKPGLFDGTNR